ncbi:MAG TPA: DNRLRE domain-containing protein, partial [Bacteroidia bacterium]|nr:DNRLRE domain-containing protein [Bacteroidia bacterium]
LNLYALGSTGNLNGHTGTANRTELRRVDANWSESLVSWDNQPTATDLITVLPQSTHALQDYTNIDVTDDVREMVADASTNHGFLIKLETEAETNALLFHSLNSGNSAKAPMLIIDVDCQSLVAVGEAIEAGFSLYPNPATQSLKLGIQLRETGNATIQLFDMQGRALSRYDAFLGSVGAHTLDLDALIADQPAGIYILRAKIGEQVTDRKLVLTGN